MAIVNNFWLKDQTKQLGGAVIYQAMGQTRSRSLAVSVTNPRTEAQMTQRVKWSNLVNLYRANASWMKYAFETKKTNQSEYNKFMSLNVSSSEIYLTKQMAAAGACVAAPYLVTQGSLPSVENTASQGVYYSNLYVGHDVDSLTTTTVRELTQMLLANNPALREGDQISLIRWTQQSNVDTGYPYVVVRRYEMLLQQDNYAFVTAYLPEDITSIDTYNGNFCLAIQPTGAAGGFAWIISRTISGKTYVSSQRIVPVNNAAMIAQYSSDAALAAAISSYGESEDAFLSTVSANQNSQASTTLSILSVNIGNTYHAAGQSWYPAAWEDEAQTGINFNGEISGTLNYARFHVYKAGQSAQFNLNEASLEQAGVEGSLPSVALQYAGWAVEYVDVVLSTGTYRIVFPIPNEATIGGLE